MMLLFLRRLWLKIMLNGPSGGRLMVTMVMFSSSVVFSIALLFLVVV